MFHRARFPPALLVLFSFCLASRPPEGPAIARQVARAARVGRDPALNQAARLHALDIAEDRNRARWDRVKQALRKEGVADAQFWPVTVMGSSPDDLLSRLRSAVKTQGAAKGATHVGAGVAHEADIWVMVALFVRRLVRISPLPEAPTDRGLLLRGRTDGGRNLEALWMGPCHDTVCQGGVQNLTVQPGGRGGWTLAVPPMTGPGSWTLELMVDTRRGPEPAILWRFGDDLRPVNPPPGPPQAWADRFRTRSALPTLRPDRRLQRAARVHAEAVCATRVAAHVWHNGRDPRHRARDAGYLGRVTENVAVAPTAAEAHRDLLRSPSHRRNILDPNAVDYGMALVTAPPQPGTRQIQCWVELFGQPQR